MDEARFWQLIDAAWHSDPRLQRFQREVLATVDSAEKQAAWLQSEAAAEAAIPQEELLIETLRSHLAALTKAELLQFDRIMERKLYEIDRADIHQFTDGSDDGFLYCRGFIVALGRDFYAAVNANPANALVDFECYAITYLSQELFQEKFGKMPPSGISRESFSNAAGWAR